MGESMSGGAIAGIVITLVLLSACIILLVLWYVRFRHYWASRRHQKMPKSVDPAYNLNGTQNKLYPGSDHSDGPASSESWMHGMATTNWNSSAFSSSSQTTNSNNNALSSSAESAHPAHYASVPAYPTDSTFHAWSDLPVAHSKMASNTAPVIPTTIIPTYQTPVIFATPLPPPAGYDLERVDMQQSSSIYPSFGYSISGDLSSTPVTMFQTSSYDPKKQQPVSDQFVTLNQSAMDSSVLEETPSNRYTVASTQAARNRTMSLLRGKGDHQSKRTKLGIRVKQVARLSQLNVLRAVSHRRTSQTPSEEPKRVRSGHRRLKSSSMSGIANLGGDSKRSALGASMEGYCNPDIFSASMDYDDMGSLDNDDFLCSLEQAVFPGLTNTETDSGSHYPPISLGSQNPTSRLYSPPTISFTDSKRVNPSMMLELASADLSLGATGSDAPSKNQFPPYNFRFPAPGPPVAGWAHQPPNPTRTSSTPTEAKPSTERFPPPMTSPSEPTTTATIQRVSRQGDTFNPDQGVGHLPVSREMLPISRRRSNTTAAMTKEGGRNRQRVQGWPGNECNNVPQPSPDPVKSAIWPAKTNRKLSTTLLEQCPVDSGYHDSSLGTSMDDSSSIRISVPHKQTSTVSTDRMQVRLIDRVRMSGLMDTHTTPCSIPPVILPYTPEVPVVMQDLYHKVSSEPPVDGLTTSSSSGRDSGDSHTMMLSQPAKERSISASRHPVKPKHPAEYYRSPSYPDLYLPHSEDSAALVTESQPTWSDVDSEQPQQQTGFG